MSISSSSSSSFSSSDLIEDEDEDENEDEDDDEHENEHEEDRVMPKKYHIHVEQTSPRFLPVPKYSVMEIEGCLGCLECVKRDACMYDTYKDHRFVPGEFVDSGESKCVMCMSCVQECKKNILSRAVNPRWQALGDAYWTPDLIERLWKQASNGKVPVSGAGYRGPFCGPGFDMIWTDMSEIVRPTRDGIHGREYISTVIELGRKPERLDFDAQGKLLTEPPTFLELPLPVVLDMPLGAMRGGNARLAIARAAGKLGTLALASLEEAAGALAGQCDNLWVKFDPATDDLKQLEAMHIAELAWSETVLDDYAKIKANNPEMILSVRLTLDEHAAERAVAMTRAGVGVIFLQAGMDGQGFGAKKEAFITRLVREVHLALVAEGIRDRVTLMASGGIALAEHVAKIILCGADGAGIDLALYAALECRLCKDCLGEPSCPVAIETAPVEWATQRLVNLVGALHSQMIEVMGAMGLREARRLRGEVGRAMFFDDLERECFAPVFGPRTKEQQFPSAVNGVSGNGATPAAAPTIALPEGFDFKSWRFGNGAQLAKPMASRYRNQFGKFKVVRTTACQACGRCAELCVYGVHKKGGPRMLAPKSQFCRGADHCKALGIYCGDACPNGALRVGADPLWETIGDKRWTADLLQSTWIQAETGRPPEGGYEYRTGGSGGGLDRMDFVFPETPPDASFTPEQVDLRIPLNRRGDGRPEVVIGFPVYGGGMSFGSISLTTMLSRARAYTAMNSFTCSGEGGYPDALKEYDDHVITQVATGLFGVREETIQRVRIVEFKYAQGAKPGLGGHLLGDKVTPAVAKIREAVEGSSLFSPFPFHSVYSVEDHKKHVDWIKHVNPTALVSVKVSTPCDVEMVAVGSYFAGAHIIHLDGSYGGTGAAPDIAKKNIAMPIEYAIPRVHRFLVQEGIREGVTLIASGGLRSAWDIAKAIALGADGVVIGTAEMVALECVRCANCESGCGCPRGIATTDTKLSKMYDIEWSTQRLINMHHSFALQLQYICWRFGMKSVRELVGRSDLLTHLDYEREAKISAKRGARSAE